MTCSRDNLMGDYVLYNLGYYTKMSCWEVNRVTSMVTPKDNPNLVFRSVRLDNPLVSVRHNYQHLRPLIAQ